MRTYEQALAEYDEECERIAENCAAEAYDGARFDDMNFLRHFER